MGHVSVNKARIRVTAKSHLTDKQYYGGPGLRYIDHAIVGETLVLIFGDYKCEAPPVCTTQWGFEAWANYLGWPKVATIRLF